MPSKQLSPAQKLLILLLLVLVSSLLSLAMGDRELNLADLGAYFQGQATSQSFILQEIRLPRLLVSLLAGGSLGLSGVLLQTFTRNPLADSSTLGINAGVGLVLTLAVTQLNLTDPFLIHYLPFLAIPGGLAMVALSFFLSHKKGEGIQPVKLIIAGVTLSTILTSSLIAITGRVDTHKLNYVVSWLAGHTTGSNWDSLNLAGPVLILLWILSYTQALPLNLLQLSDPAALGLGLPLRRQRAIVLLLASALIAFSLTLAGNISLVGLLASHMTRLLFPSDHRWRLPAALLIGALLLLIADTLTRTYLIGSNIPTGIPLTLIGSPYFLYLLRREGSKVRSLR
ncbi:iron ABC transporter permease [Streptococcus danieliae]|uniref:Iron ABC transporter permease n=2 Tax=Streptococcus danieliae TaxID=747656 RepID=A0A7Z0S483_9STRE|nr:iron ABC transporter permease [Streptococcus danieliae]NYS33360.1 iron ABC transporter permease [Streptococcus danieliae]NYS95959.1 iron ABC transporter permease [Streptococcus danieliae]